MDRRRFLSTAGAGAGLLTAAASGRAQDAVAQCVDRRRASLRIDDVRVVLDRSRADSLGDRQGRHQSAGALRRRMCATFTQRIRLAAQAAEQYLKPFLAREGPAPHRRRLAVVVRQLVLAKRPGAQQRHERRRYGPLGHPGQSEPGCRFTSSLGGKTRNAVDVYRHASGASHDASGRLGSTVT